MSEWSGYCEAGIHGLDYEDQPCDLCSQRCAACGAERESGTLWLHTFLVEKPPTRGRMPVTIVTCSLAVCMDKARALVEQREGASVVRSRSMSD